MKIFKNKFFYCLLLAGLGISISACSTDNPSSVPSSNEPTSSASTSSENHSSSEDSSNTTSVSSEDSSSTGSTTSSNIDGDNGSESGNNNTPPASNDRSEAAKFVHNLNIEVDPAKAILGDDSNASSQKSKIKKAISGEDDPELYSLRRLTDLVGGTYEEKADYCSWTNLGIVYDDIADRIIGSCDNFGDSLEMLDMFKDYIPDDIQYGQSRSVTVKVQAGPSPEYVIDVPMKFYIDKNASGFTFALYYNAMGNEASMSIKAENLSESRTKYTFKTYSPGRCDYFGIQIRPTSDPHGYYRMYWNETKQEYYYYNYDYESFNVRGAGTDYVVPVNFIGDTATYLSHDSATGTITKLYGSALDIYAYDNNDGTINLKAEPTKGGVNPTDAGKTQRWVVKDSCQISTWIDGESYERVGLYDVPAYAMGYTNASFFKAYKDDDNHWRIYRSFGYAGNECFATQDDKGWYMLYDYGRDESTGDVQVGACKIGSLDGAEIGEYGNQKSMRLKLNAFDGFDEIRAAKSDTRLMSNVWINDQMVDSYYTTNENAELYRNGTRIFQANNNPDHTQDSQFVSVDVSSRGFKFASYDQNNRAYGATMVLASGYNEGTHEYYNHYSSDAVSSYLTSLGLTLKFGDHNLTPYLNKAQDILNHASDYISAFDYYNIPQKQTRFAFYQNLANNVYPLIDCKAELAAYFA